MDKNTYFCKKIMRYSIEFSYCGKKFFGYQIQPNQISVQEELEKALSTVLREEIKTREEVEPVFDQEIQEEELVLEKDDILWIVGDRKLLADLAHD